MRHFGLVLPSHPGFCGSSALQVWKSEEGDLLDTWVRRKQEVSSRLLAHLRIRASVCSLCCCFVCSGCVARTTRRARQVNGRPPCRACTHLWLSPVCTRGTRILLLRNGWYCSEHELNMWWDLAGWRGLQTPAVREHFSNTFYSFGGPDDTDWGPNADLMKNLNLNYTLNFMGENADAILADRLRSVLPTLLYLWSPHPLLAMYQLNRISLPTYKNQALFDQGITDFPTDTLEKVASKTLAELAPRVYQMYSRFGLENSDQVDMLDNAERLGSTMQAACAWLTSPEHVDTWRGWIPEEEFTCNTGQYMIDGAVPRCEDCPKGTKGAGGKVTTCTSCAPGAAMRLRLCVCVGMC